jgi:hypothetical protein
MKQINANIYKERWLEQDGEAGENDLGEENKDEKI